MTIGGRLCQSETNRKQSSALVKLIATTGGITRDCRPQNCYGVHNHRSSLSTAWSCGDEYGVLQAEAGYSRLYGGSGQYTTGSTFAVGHPAFVLGALATQAMVNQSRRAAAARDAAVQWRDHQSVSVLITNQRLLCNTASRGWLSFWFGGVTELYPDLSSWGIAPTLVDI